MKGTALLVILATAGILYMLVWEILNSSSQVVARSGGKSDWRYLSMEGQFVRFSPEGPTLEGHAHVRTFDIADEGVTAAVRFAARSGLQELDVGGTLGSLEFKREPGGMYVRSDLRLVLERKVGAFWYPFDRYAFLVEPRAVARNGAQTWYPRVNPLVLNFGLPGFVAYQTTPPENSDVIGSSVGVELARPAFLQILASVVAVLTCAWLFWILRQTSVAIQSGQLIGFFVAAWSWRSLLGQPEGQGPHVLDYFFLLVSVLAVLAVGRQMRLTPPTADQTCPACFGAIDARATRCRHCGGEVKNE